MIAGAVRHVARVRNKILEGKPVSIGVFCSGNGDRSPLAEQVLRKEFRNRGLGNVHVFSFGLSVSPASHLKGAADRTAAYARELGYTEINDHQRRHVGDADVTEQIKKADLLIAVSPMHLGYLAEYGADENQQAAPAILSKTQTLKGLASNKMWTMPLDGFARFANRLYRRGLASKDPYFQPKTPEGEKRFRAMLDDVVSDARKAAARLTKTRNSPD